MHTATPAAGAADLTAPWCTAALAGVLGGGGGKVVDVSAAAVGNGLVADTFRLTLAYEPAEAGPTTVIAKVPAADDTSRLAARLTGTYEVESSFYRELAPTLPVRAPRCFDAAYDPATGDYHVLLEDAAPAEAADQLTGCSVADIEMAIDELVLLQGPRWGDETLLDIGWLNRAQPPRLDDTATLVLQCVPPFLQRFGDRLEPSTVALIERLVPKLRASMHNRPRPWTIVHGDYRGDNLLFGGERAVVVDWQTVGAAPGTFDLTYLLGGSMVPELRRQHERDLVARYSEGIRAHGHDVDDEWVWTGYRRSSFGGLVMAIVASALVRQTGRGDEMFLVMAERPAVQVADLDGESLLVD